MDNTLQDAGLYHGQVSVQEKEFCFWNKMPKHLTWQGEIGFKNSKLDNFTFGVNWNGLILFPLASQSWLCILSSVD